MIMNRLQGFALAAAATVLGTGLTFVAPAQAATSPTPMATPAVAASCHRWHDKNTQGVACPDNPSAWASYRAWASCNNGRTVYGRWTTSWQWSYAYCTSVNSSRSDGAVNFR